MERVLDWRGLVRGLGGGEVQQARPASVVVVQGDTEIQRGRERKRESVGETEGKRSRVSGKKRERGKEI